VIRRGDLPGYRYLPGIAELNVSKLSICERAGPSGRFSYEEKAGLAVGKCFAVMVLAALILVRRQTDVMLFSPAHAIATKARRQSCPPSEVNNV